MRQTAFIHLLHCSDEQVQTKGQAFACAGWALSRKAKAFSGAGDQQRLPAGGLWTTPPGCCVVQLLLLVLSHQQRCTRNFIRPVLKAH